MGNPAEEVRDHGGSLGRARALFPFAPEPWIDLSTGISPHPYPLPPVPASAWARLPEDGEVADLCVAAARAYGAPGADYVVAAPGTQILLPLVAALVPGGRARMLGPTYAEHARGAALAGHRVEETSELASLREADLVVVVNPNNPDGRLTPAADLLALAVMLDARGGLLVVDEAFMDVCDAAHSMAEAVARHPNLVVLRSFGKFHGLAGVRLGFALAAPPLAARLGARLGPWAVSGPAIAVGRAALGDEEWRRRARTRLAGESEALDRVLAARGLTVSGGTSLYRFLRHPDARAVFEACGRHGVYLRRFDAMPDALRIGLPPDGEALSRLDAALREWAKR